MQPLFKGILFFSYHSLRSNFTNEGMSQLLSENAHNKLWNIGFIHLLIINIVNSTAFGIITPITPGYMVNMGTNLTIAGIIMGIFPITALLTRPLANVMGDNLNKKWLIFIAMGLSGVIVVLYAIPTNVIWLVPIRILHGFLFSIAGTVTFSLGADYIPKIRLGEGIGYLGVGHIIGMAIGPNIAIFLLEHFTYEFCFVLSGIIMVAVALSVVFIRYRHNSPKAEKIGKTTDKAKFRFNSFIAVEVLPFAGFAAILSISLGLVNSYLVMMGVQRLIYGIGIYFVVNAVIQVLSRPYLGRLADRKGVGYVVVPGFIFVAAAMIIISISYSVWPLLIAALLMAIGTGGTFPALQANCLRKVDAARRTVATGTYFIGFDVGMSIGQMTGGSIIDSTGFSAAYGMAAVVALVGLCFYMIFSRYEKYKTKENIADVV